MKDNPLEENLVKFSQKIISGVFPLIKHLDEQISKYAPEWPFDQVAIIDRNIFRIALWEMVFDPETPIKVIINEAVELGKLFGSDATPTICEWCIGECCGKSK